VVRWSGGQERQEPGEKLVRELQVWDMAAVGYHHPLGAGYVSHGLLGESLEVAESGRVLGFGVLSEWDDVIVCPDDQQCRGGDQVILMAGCW
jgi:hypothetical protein